jgi:hypothetical protein
MSLPAFGWLMGFEPTTPRTTIWCSNLLSYSHRFLRCKYTIILLLTRGRMKIIYLNVFRQNQLR